MTEETNVKNNVDNNEEIIDNVIYEVPSEEPSIPTVYEVCMANMTPQTLANLGVKLISVNGSDLFWVTSTGQLYAFNAHKMAIEAELAWLLSKHSSD